MSTFKHLYVENIVDVVGDINCEFRVIVALLGKGVELCSTILHDLVRKLNTNHKKYVELYVSKERGKELIHSLWPVKCVCFILEQKKVVIYMHLHLAPGVCFRR